MIYTIQTLKMTKNSIIIETQNLSKSLAVSDSENLQILNQINLQIRSSESVAITGASGSGKTTLLGLLAGLDIPSEGQVILFNQSLSQLEEDERALLRLGKVGFVFQSFHLMDNLTALENVMLPLEINQESSLSIAEIRKKANAALEQVGLADRVSHLPTQLSGGEQQRVALARAFVTHPKVLFADEPTGNLDSKTGEEIVELLFNLQKENNTTLVLVTHDNMLAKQCETHYKLEKGQLVD